ncbi:MULTISPECIES: PrsW family intramembrane metalloprotease [Erysipelotrichaceae]|jgi:RsiW-degrading membrane proteinase PrsW (M82 family)|uniref:PrsW family intramembrane metalloprotease n=1 Tax=Erysipelotrichaceae TaxID=128827 RepID=UPI000CFA1A92|nr:MULTISPECIES: PrsW family glutamic-type intramembrane protease [Erysipelotrichaceae]MDD5881615.1 PrsW family glutamic-type intramembrane protease [Stecheria intestinalis]MDD6365741.1 PrsW family glutamic-type intramembrane protease [Stecheria intestinalis]
MSHVYDLPIVTALIYLAAAITPAAVLLRFIYQNDKIEKEPARLLVSLLFGGVLAALAAMVLEWIGEDLLIPSLPISEGTASAAIADAILVGISEEGAKFYFLKRRSWNQPAFNYRFDGVVYAVFVSLGFAAFENILYIAQYGLSIALSRALLAIPAHLSFGVFLGSYYGRAKVCDVYGDDVGRSRNLLAGFVSAAGLHAFYDGCIMVNTSLSTAVFAIFVIALFCYVYREVKKESQEDLAI